MNDRFKLKIRPLVQSRIGRFIINLIRFIKALYSSSTDCFNHLQDIHKIWLKLERHERNLAFLPHLIYTTQSYLKPKDFYRTREYSVFSQNGEDGLLLYILSKIGVVNPWFVEFGAGGFTSNTLMLAQQYGWNGLSLDGDKDSIREMNNLYNEIMLENPERSLQAVSSWLTRENINSVLTEAKAPKEIDLLSVDIDGIDYWLWDAVKVINPRVVIMEYNASFGQENAVSIPYDESFYRWDNKNHPNGWYYGTSLAALSYLADLKGYALVACESTGVNVFFVRKELISDELPSQSVHDAFHPDKRRQHRASHEEQIASMSNFALVDVKNSSN